MKMIILIDCSLFILTFAFAIICTILHRVCKTEKSIKLFENALAFTYAMYLSEVILMIILLSIVLTKAIWLLV